MNYNSDDEIVELFYSVAKISRYTPEGVRGLPAFIGQYRRLRLLDEMGTARQSALVDSMDIRPSSLPHGTALLTSLRTISGAIGSAVFSGIMTAVAADSASAYGQNAPMHGLNVTFLVMSAVTVILVLIAVFLVGGKKCRQ